MQNNHLFYSSQKKEAVSTVIDGFLPVKY